MSTPEPWLAAALFHGYPRRDPKRRPLTAAIQAANQTPDAGAIEGAHARRLLGLWRETTEGRACAQVWSPITDMWLTQNALDALRRLPEKPL